jgi:RsiW-degrading membrane proteinase PrsW (M82 family)
MNAAAFVLTIALSFIPAVAYAVLLYYMDRFEKEPKRLLVAAFAWGALIATTGAIIGTQVLQAGVIAFTGDEEIANATGIVLFAPIVEEITKGAAVLLVFLLFHAEFDSILDGMIYAGIAALGFAATENVLYLYYKGFLPEGWPGLFGLFFLRVVLGGWLHPAFTVWFGAGLAVARLSRSPWRFMAPLAGLGVGMGSHALHNLMGSAMVERFGLGGLAATLAVDWVSWGVVFFVFLLALFQERRWLRTHLAEEVSLGYITPEQYAVAGSIRAQLQSRLRGGGARAFYEACAELAFKKAQLSLKGDEQGNLARIGVLRDRVLRMRAGTPPALRAGPPGPPPLG